MTQKQFEDKIATILQSEIERLKRRTRRLQAVLSGDATYEKTWREGYKEKKIREVKGHWMHYVKRKAA